MTSDTNQFQGSKEEQLLHAIQGEELDDVKLALAKELDRERAKHDFPDNVRSYELVEWEQVPNGSANNSTYTKDFVSSLKELRGRGYARHPTLAEISTLVEDGLANKIRAEEHHAVFGQLMAGVPEWISLLAEFNPSKQAVTLYLNPDGIGYYPSNNKFETYKKKNGEFSFTSLFPNIPAQVNNEVIKQREFRGNLCAFKVYISASNLPLTIAPCTALFEAEGPWEKGTTQKMVDNSTAKRITYTLYLERPYRAGDTLNESVFPAMCSVPDRRIYLDYSNQQKAVSRGVRPKIMQ